MSRREQYYYLPYHYFAQLSGVYFQEQELSIADHFVVDESTFFLERNGFNIFDKTFFLSLKCSWCYKTFFGRNVDFQKIKKLKKFVLMSEPAQTFNKNAIFKQN